MNYAPSAADRVLHDTWVFLHGEDIHLFFLAPQVDNNMHRLIGHAVSRDWLHWKEHSFIELTGSAGEWDAGRIGTGHVFQHDDGRFYMAYTGRIDPREDIGLAVSDDLESWTKVASEPVWPQRLQPPYEANALEVGLSPAWRDPFVVRGADGTWYAFLCARAESGPRATRGCVGCCRLEDLGCWETLAPLATDCRYPVMEVPELFAFAGRWWMTFNTGSAWGRRLDTVSRRSASGTFFLVADHWRGPWQEPADNLLLGSGGGRRDAVVARSVEQAGQRLVYHHYTGSLVADSARAFGLPKVLDSVGDHLVLRPWPGLRAIRGHEVRFDPWRTPRNPLWAPGTWTEHDGVLTGTAADAASVCFAGADVADIDVTADVVLEAGCRAGLLLRADDEVQHGCLVMLDQARGEIALATPAKGGYSMLLDNVLDRVCLRIEHNREYRLRVLCRDRYAEVFVEDCLVFSTVVGRPRGGGLAAVVDDAKAAFRIRDAHVLEPMVRPG